MGGVLSRSNHFNNNNNNEIYNLQLHAIILIRSATVVLRCPLMISWRPCAHCCRWASIYIFNSRWISCFPLLYSLHCDALRSKQRNKTATVMTATTIKTNAKRDEKWRDTREIIFCVFFRTQNLKLNRMTVVVALFNAFQTHAARSFL